MKQYQEIPSTRGEQQKHLNDNDNDKNNDRYNERREKVGKWGEEMIYYCKHIQRWGRGGRAEDIWR